MAQTVSVQPRQLGFAFDAEEQTQTPMAKSKIVKKKKPAKVSPTAPAGKSARTKPPAAEKKPPVAAATEPKTPVVQSAQDKTPRKRAVQALSDDHIEAKAKEMAGSQREISVSEFFAKNRHLLGFDNPSKALLTAVKEAVDNSLDACEEAQILPDLEIIIRQLAEDRFSMSVQDNGPGIVKNQIPNIFGRLLYGSKFHRLRMSRGQQGIGISAAGMYGLLTTGKPVKIVSKTGPRAQAHYYELRIDTKVNRPEIIKDEPTDWDVKSGTRVEIEMEGRFQRGRQSVDEYLAQTAITNPHARIRYLAPDGQDTVYERADDNVVEIPKAIKPHPYGVELGVLMKMAKDTAAKTMTAFLTDEFSRVSDRVSQDILDKAKLSARKNPHQITPADAEKLHRAVNEIKIMAPSTDCIVPIGEEALQKSLQRVVEADFYRVITRPPSVYRGNPFQIEVALAYGGSASAADEGDEDDIFEKGKNGSNGDEQQIMRVMRFANRVPLLYQQSACAVFKAITGMNWRQYGLSQSRGALPAGPVTVIVHIASVWVPFTSESKEAVAHYPEIIKEVKLALADCGRALNRYIRGKRREREESLKRSYIQKYMPAIGEALRDILKLKDKQVAAVLEKLEAVLERTRGQKSGDDDDDDRPRRSGKKTSTSEEEPSDSDDDSAATEEP